MPDTTRKVSELTSAAQLNNTDLLLLSQGSVGSYASLNTTLLALASKIVANTNYTSDLHTNSKTITGALNEIFASGNLADTYDTTETYNPNDYCIYNGILYKCTAQTTGEFDSNDWLQTTITDELANGGTTVVANPSGTSTDELTSIQIGNDIYEIPSGSGGTAEWTDVVGTLIAGQTEITLTSIKIKTTSAVFPWTDKFGVAPTNMVVTNGSVTLTFPAQTTDLGVMVRVSKLNTARIYQVLLTEFDGTRVWYRYGSTAGAEAISTGLKISGNDQRNDWIGQSVICIDLNEFDIPDYFEKMYIHLVSGDTSEYAGLYAVSTNTLYSQSSSVADADLLNATKISSAILWNYINGISVSDYVFEIECLPSDFGRYLYIVGSDGIVPEGGISNTNNGSWNFVIDGIGFE